MTHGSEPLTLTPPWYCSSAEHVGLRISAAEPGTGVPPTVGHAGVVLLRPVTAFTGRMAARLRKLSSNVGARNDVPQLPRKVKSPIGDQLTETFGFRV